MRRYIKAILLIAAMIMALPTVIIANGYPVTGNDSSVNEYQEFETLNNLLAPPTIQHSYVQTHGPYVFPPQGPINQTLNLLVSAHGTTYGRSLPLVRQDWHLQSNGSWLGYFVFSGTLYRLDLLGRGLLTQSEIDIETSQEIIQRVIPGNNEIIYEDGRTTVIHELIEHIFDAPAGPPYSEILEMDSLGNITRIIIEYAPHITN